MLGAVNPVIHHNQHAAAFCFGIRRDTNGVVKVQRSVGADSRRGPHRADHHDRFVRLDRQIEEEGGLLHGIGAVRNHDAIDIVGLCQVIDPLRNFEQNVE